MIIRTLFKNLMRQSSIIKIPRYGIISKLFQKKNEEDAQIKRQKIDKNKDKQKQTIKEMQDEQYDFFQRRKQIDTNIDFSKLRELNTTYIPQNLGKGGIQQVIYWSQNVSTPEQIQQLVIIFNRVINESLNSIELYKNDIQLNQFKINVINSVYLINNLGILYQYALFAFRYEIKDKQFWQKIQFKCLRYNIQTQQNISNLIDISFIMGNFTVGQEIYNYVQKILINNILNIDQNIKMYIIFSNLKKGQKQWIQKLIIGINNTIHQANTQQLSGVLQNLKDAKKLPEQLNGKIEKRVNELLNDFTLLQILNISEYFGFEHDNEQFWKKIEQRLQFLLKDKKKGIKILQNLIYKCMLTYKFTIQFIRRHIVKVIEQTDYKILQKFTIITLSALSKGLYIYQLQKQTVNIQQQISKLIISKITKDINEIKDIELVKVIQDYNLTRHGSRQIYIFFEQVIKLKYIRNYNPEMNRNIIQFLIQIYQNSGMCSREMYSSLQNLILD